MRYAAAVLVIVLGAGCNDSTTAPVPVKLTFTLSPPTAVHGAPMTSFFVAIVDANGQIVMSATNPVTVKLQNNPVDATLSGTTTVAAVNGVATFTGLSVDKPWDSFTMTATAVGITSGQSSFFSITAGPAVKLAFLDQPNTVLHGANITLRVAVEDADGYIVKSPPRFVQLELAQNPGAAVISGATTANTVNGIATFTVFISTVADGYSLQATSVGLMTAATAPFNVIAGPPDRLTFITPPTTTSPGATLDPVKVAVQDATGATVLSATHSVTVAISGNPASGVLSGTKTIAAVNGIATFNDLSIDKEGQPYTLSAVATGLSSDLSPPFSIRQLMLFSTMTAGYFHACGQDQGGAAYCWGDNSAGALGSTLSVYGPAPVSGGVAFTSVSSGRSHTCGLTSTGSAYCWGAAGRIGDGTSQQRNLPTAVSGGRQYSVLSAGYSHSCAITTGGDAYCWGDNGSGQIGAGTSATAVTSPAAVSGGLKFAGISAGRLFTCATTTGGAAYCWGDNNSLELGTGNNTSSNSPIAVTGGNTFTTVSAGGFHACGLTSAGVVMCWGDNFVGQLGDGTSTSRSGPVTVFGNLTFASISAGNRHTCGVTTTGVGYCWGDNSGGLLGGGAIALPQNKPVAVSGGLTFASITAGRFHTCGVATNGMGYCWGSNVGGILGASAPEFSTTPLRVR